MSSGLPTRTAESLALFRRQVSIWRRIVVDDDGDEPPSSAGCLHRAVAVDAGDADPSVGGAATGACARAHVAQRHAAGGLSPAYHAPATRTAITAAALVASLTRRTAGLARIDDPVASRVAGHELLAGEVERGMARVGARRRVQIDRRDPELLRRRRQSRIVVARVTQERILRRDVAVHPAAGEDHPRIAA